MNLTWEEEDNNKVDVVRKPTNAEQDNNDETHLDNLPFLFDGPRNSWLSY